MALAASTGSRLEPNNTRRDDVTPKLVTMMQGYNWGTDGTESSELVAIGSMAAGEIFHLQRAIITMKDYTTTASYDLMIGANYAGTSNRGKAYVYSGADGGLLYEEEGEADLDWFGSSVSGVGDVNGDGKDDFIIGANRAKTSHQGKAYVYSGADGSLIWSEEGEAADNAFGHSVSGVGDVNGDGKDDFIVGAYNAGTSGQGKAYVYVSQ